MAIELTIRGMVKTQKTGNPEIGARLKRARMNVGMTQPEALVALGRDPRNTSWLTNKESGTRGVSADELAAFAKLYGVTTDEIIGVPPSHPENILSRLSQQVVAIPVLEIDAHAGGEGDAIVDYVYREVPKEAIGHRLAAIRVKGDCLSPEIIEGDLVTFDMDKTATPGKLVVIAGEGAPRLCRYEVRKGEPVGVNNDGVVILKDVRIVGVVIQRSRDM